VSRPWPGDVSEGPEKAVFIVAGRRCCAPRFEPDGVRSFGSRPRKRFRATAASGCSTSLGDGRS